VSCCLFYNFFLLIVSFWNSNNNKLAYGLFVFCGDDAMLWHCRNDRSCGYFFRALHWIHLGALWLLSFSAEAVLYGADLTGLPCYWSKVCTHRFSALQKESSSSANGSNVTYLTRLQVCNTGFAVSGWHTIHRV